MSKTIYFEDDFRRIIVQEATVTLFSTRASPTGMNYEDEFDRIAGEFIHVNFLKLYREDFVKTDVYEIISEKELPFIRLYSRVQKCCDLLPDEFHDLRLRVRRSFGQPYYLEGSTNQPDPEFLDKLSNFGYHREYLKLALRHNIRSPFVALDLLDKHNNKLIDLVQEYNDTAEYLQFYSTPTECVDCGKICADKVAAEIHRYNTDHIRFRHCQTHEFTEDDAKTKVLEMQKKLSRTEPFYQTEPLEIEKARILSTEVEKKTPSDDLYYDDSEDERDFDEEIIDPKSRGQLPGPLELIKTCISQLKDIRDDRKGGEALQVILKYVSNLLEEPEDPKYHIINMYNHTFRFSVARFICGPLLLVSLGFERKFDQGILEISPENIDLALLTETKRRIENALEQYERCFVEFYIDLARKQGKIIDW